MALTISNLSDALHIRLNGCYLEMQVLILIKIADLV